MEQMNNQFAKLFDVTRNGHAYQVLITKGFDSDRAESWVMLQIVVGCTLVKNTLRFATQAACDQSFDGMGQDFADGFINSGLIADFVDQVVAEQSEAQS